jgi:hypothetical protein
MAPRPPYEWHERFESARSTADVVEACQEFVARFAPSVLAELPRDCLPPINLDAPAIADYSVELVRAELEQGPDASPLLSTFAIFFTDASQAIARIAMARKRPDLFSTQVKDR